MPPPLLQQLAGLCGIQTAYRDVKGKRCTASPETLRRMLAAMGVSAGSDDQVRSSLRQRRQEVWNCLAEPVVVAWDGGAKDLRLRLPAGEAEHDLHLRLEMEGGEVLERRYSLDERQTIERHEVEGQPYLVKSVPLPDGLPHGYHLLTLAVGAKQQRTRLIAAPRKAYQEREATGRRAWGFFTPVYALHSDESWGAGNLADLEALWEWTAEQGGRLVATLPLLAAFLDEPYEPSPYAPVSRLFWNELYLHVPSIAELRHCPEAQELMASTGFQQEVAALRSAELVDYRRQMRLMRSVLSRLGECCFQRGGERREALEQFARRRPQVEDYARFRAVCDRQRTGWSQWPQRQRDGRLLPEDYDERDFRYHLYVQWILQQQVDRLIEQVERSRSGLYLDLPLGVHRDGYDTWRERDLFALGASGGAPPDAFFTKGQVWGFAPLDPHKLRQRGYDHVIQYVQHHLKHCRLLRIDHVMQLHRIFWVPEGLEASEGAYVRYPAEELYAIVALESHRNRAAIVGENLGTVPREVNSAMHRHGIAGMYVLQYEAVPGSEPPLRPVPKHCVASLNTHDMFPFAAFWQGKDLEEVHELGLFDNREVAEERDKRRQLRAQIVEMLRREGCLDADAAQPDAVAEALHRWLAASDAEVVLLNLEDLWLEIEPQNLPNTSHERPNWRRKTRYSLEEIKQRPGLDGLLRQVDRLRTRSAAGLPVGS